MEGTRIMTKTLGSLARIATLSPALAYHPGSGTNF